MAKVGWQPILKVVIYRRTLKIGVGLFNSKIMFDTKTRIKILTGIIFFLLCFLNINVITEKNNNCKLFIPSISTTAQAEGEGSYPIQGYNCEECVPAPGQSGVVFDCIESPVNDCFKLPCGYGGC